MTITTKELGKIASVDVVLGGRGGDTLGVSFSFTGRGWGVSDFWPLEFDCPILKSRMVDAGCMKLHQMVGKPVEVTFEDNMIKSWRILTEVL